MLLIFISWFPVCHAVATSWAFLSAGLSSMGRVKLWHIYTVDEESLGTSVPCML